MHCGEIPRNCSPAHTCGHCCFGCPSGDKGDMTGTYLSDAAAHGARIFTGDGHPAPHPSILQQGNRLAGVLAMVHIIFSFHHISVPAVVLVERPVKQRDRHDPADIRQLAGGSRRSCVKRAVFPAQTAVFGSLSLAGLHPAAFTGSKHDVG